MRASLRTSPCPVPTLAWPLDTQACRAGLPPAPRAQARGHQAGQHRPPAPARLCDRDGLHWRPCSLTRSRRPVLYTSQRRGTPWREAWGSGGPRSQASHAPAAPSPESQQWPCWPEGRRWLHAPWMAGLSAQWARAAGHSESARGLATSPPSLTHGRRHPECTRSQLHGLES